MVFFVSNGKPVIDYLEFKIETFDYVEFKMEIFDSNKSIFNIGTIQNFGGKIISYCGFFFKAT